MTATEKMNLIYDLTRKIQSNPLADKEDVRSFYLDVMKLVVDYKMIGRIYDFCAEDLDYYRDRRMYTRGVDYLVNETMAFTAAFPDVVADIEDTIVCKDGDGWKICGRMRFRGTNLGASYMGPPTGKSLGEGGLAIHFVYLKPVDGRLKVWKMICANSAEWIQRTLTPDEAG